MLTTMLIAAVGVNRTPHGEVGVRPRCSLRSIRQPRRFQHCSCHFSSIQTMPSQRRSLSRGFLLCSRRICGRNLVRNFVLRMHLRVELAAPLPSAHKRHGSLCTIWPKRRQKIHRAPCTMDVLPPHHLFWNWIRTRCFRTIFKGKHINLLERE